MTGPRDFHIITLYSLVFRSGAEKSSHRKEKDTIGRMVGSQYLVCNSFHKIKQAEIIEAFKSTSRYLNNLLNIDSPYFEGMVNQIYPPELQLNKAKTSYTEAPFLDLHL